MKRRQFVGTVAGCLAAGGVNATSSSMTLAGQLPILGHCNALPGQAAFRAICGTEFHGRALQSNEPNATTLVTVTRQTQLRLQAVEPAYPDNPHQFFLRFTADRSQLVEGIYRLSNDRYDWLLHLSPAIDKPGQLVAVMNTQPVYV